MELVFKTSSKEETQELAKRITSYLKGGDVCLLTGDLGAGKTTFVKGVAKYLNIKEDIISPTFNILKCYFESTPNLYHIDAYRLEDHNVDIGLDEFIEGEGITMIEWPQYIENLIPKTHLEISLKNIGDSNREIVIKSDSSRFNDLFKGLEK